MQPLTLLVQPLTLVVQPLTLPVQPLTLVVQPLTLVVPIARGPIAALGRRHNSNRSANHHK